jgi:hypothetical protein
LVAVLITSGCGAVLSKPQAAAIQGFANADDSFVKLPSTVVRSYEQVHLEARTFDATTVAAKDASRGVTQLVHAIQFSQELEALAVELDAAAEVLGQYAALLRGLSSDMGGGVDETATALGGALDKSIDSYNQVFGAKSAPLPLVGTAAAAAARAVAGLYVKHQQLVYLRELVRRADPLVTRLATDVDVLIRSFVGPDGHLGADATSIQASLAAYASTRGMALAVSDVHLFGEALRKEVLAEKLAENVRKISVRLAKAHSALKGVLDPRPSVESALAEVQVLVTELQAAARVKAKLDSPNQEEKE